MPQALPTADAARAICAQHGNAASELLEILHDVQDRLGHIAPDCLPVIADSLNLSKAEVHGVVSFYHDFKTEPDGRVVVKICQAEACRSMGAVALTEQILSRHGVSLSEKTAGVRACLLPRQLRIGPDRDGRWRAAWPGARRGCG